VAIREPKDHGWFYREEFIILYLSPYLQKILVKNGYEEEQEEQEEKREEREEKREDHVLKILNVRNNQNANFVWINWRKRSRR
jgi:hypothetical protein